MLNKNVWRMLDIKKTFDLRVKKEPYMADDITSASTEKPVARRVISPILEKYFKEKKMVFMRCVTYHYTGIVESYDDKFVRLTKAAWIAESGDFEEALKTGKFGEFEPYPQDIVVNLDSVVDIASIPSVPTSKSKK